MAHYAILDENNVVVNVIVGRDEDEIVDGITDWEQFYSDETGMRVLRTSINMFGGVHSEGKEPFRYNFASIGGYYDEERDAFVGPPPHECMGKKFVLDPDTMTWVFAEPYPMDGFGYKWDPDVHVWFKAGPDVPIPDLNKNWFFDDRTNQWIEMPQPN